VRVVQRDADFDTAVLERVDVGHLGQPSQLFVPIRPDVDQQLDMAQGQASERGVRVLGEHHDLAHAVRRSGGNRKLRRIVCAHCQRREKILEHRHVPRPTGDFGRVLGVVAGRERVVFRWRQKCPVLPVSGVGNPLAAQRVPAEMGVRCVRRVARARRLDIVGQRVTRVQDKRTPIGLGQDPLEHQRASPDSAIF
jgi:hypothetical protein